MCSTGTYVYSCFAGLTKNDWLEVIPLKIKNVLSMLENALEQFLNALRMLFNALSMF